MIEVIYWLFQIYSYMIIAYVLLSWLPNARESVIGDLLAKFVEPYLSPFRRFIPPIFGMIDISPIIALIALRFASYGLISLIGNFV
ncbi:YggT family protein [Paenibacillus sp. CMAA1739]|uniref:YggT family protein n=1 Tax=Paenibacillus ottowii TaxID=2315729 RepID=A0ABY3B1X4_9BACL|nr:MULTISPECIES: YggT family protein [Paenibacillus]KZE73053.1 cell division protein [Paenibacillus jamilae]MDP1509010.1 YggT family protein [Paenibacillus ottowii]MEC4564865.1 YggT family protein [Paenibacillus sp. CMAA1739]NEU26343.1 YggT family protein [Paenibacillus polymyxa]OBA06536.1 cell division protein [Paenibacillus polymyxa]